jgi:hypothetical protein
MRKFTGSWRWFSTLSLGLGLALRAPLAAAKSSDSAAISKEKKTVLVGGFEGPKSAQARRAVIAALKEDGEYDIAETSEAKPGSDDKTFANASHGAAAVLVGNVKRTGLLLAVHNGADGALIQDVEIKGDSPAKLSKNIGNTLALSVADAIAQTTASAAVAKPEAADNDAKPEKTSSEDEPKSAAGEEADTEKSQYPDNHSPLELDAGLRAVHRSFTYHDTPAQLFPQNNYPAPRTYKLPLGPALFLDGSIYPLAFASRGLLSNIGITAGYELNFATKSVHDEGTALQGDLTTKAHQYYVGLKGRIPISTHEIDLVAAYGQQVFNLLGDEAQPTVPDVAYEFFRTSLEGRLRFNAVTLGFHLGTRFVTSTGGLERDWFPGHVKTQEIEGGISVGYTLAPPLDLIFGLDVTRYAFNFNPIPDNASPTGSQVIAGGAVDQYTSGFIGLRYSFASHK